MGRLNPEIRTGIQDRHADGGMGHLVTSQDLGFLVSNPAE
jgi:hypothetical protein